MKFIRVALKVLWTIIKYILAIIIILALTFGLAALISILQEILFVPEEYVAWIIHDSAIRVVFAFETIFGILFFYFNYRKKPDFSGSDLGKIAGFIKRHKRSTSALLVVALVLSLYYMVANITVVLSDKIVNHSFFIPQGKEYLYSDIKVINTGVYGKKIPYVRSKGEFYYIVELNDGVKFNLSNINGTGDDKDIYDVMVDVDRGFVKAGASKKTDMTHFDLLTEHLAKQYSDKIKSILENVK